MRATALLFLVGFPLLLPAEDRVRILVFGDSLTRGYGLNNPEETAYPALLRDKIDRFAYPATLMASGVSGETTAGGRARLGWVMQEPQEWSGEEPYRIDILILALGGNDGLRGLQIEKTRANLLAIIDQARDRFPEIQILLAGVEMPRNLGEPYISDFRSIFPAVARAAEVELLPSLMAGIGTSPDLMQPDQIHPNEAGHQVMAEAVWIKLEPMIRRELE